MKSSSAVPMPEVMETAEEGAVAEDLVDERIGSLFRRQVDGQPEGARLGVDLAFHRAGVGRFHQPRPSARDDVDAHPGQLEAEHLHFVVDRIAVTDARAAEDRDAVVLDLLGLDLVEIVDGLPKLVDRLVEDVARVETLPLRLSLPQGFELGSGGGRFALGHRVYPERDRCHIGEQGAASGEREGQTAAASLTVKFVRLVFL